MILPKLINTFVAVGGKLAPPGGFDDSRRSSSSSRGWRVFIWHSRRWIRCCGTRELKLVTHRIWVW